MHPPSPIMAAPGTIRLLLVDDHPIMRTGLANVLNLEPGFSVIAQADDGETALRLWREHQPDVGLFDLSLPGMDGIETLRLLRAEVPEARVLMLTSSETQEDVRHALKAGAGGYITKNARGPELIAAIREVHAGGQHISDHIARRLGEEEQGGQLSRREIEVLGFVRHGYTNAEIGRLLGITERTVRAHLELIMGKLDAADRAAAVARGFERGLLKI
jgi:DNA-binding NarL/FixJ family response regulator